MFESSPPLVPALLLGESFFIEINPLPGPGQSSDVLAVVTPHRRWQHTAHCTHSGGEERSTDISSNGCPLVYMDMGMDTTSTSIKENRAQHVFANFILLVCGQMLMMTNDSN